MMKIKVGMMPGRLVEVVVEEGTTAREIFKVAEVELSNHEIRLDGEKIDLDKTINNGSLLVAMKMIKGNSDVYVTDCTDEEVEMLLGVALPREINKNNVSTCGENFLEVNVDSELLVVDKDMFNSVYNVRIELNKALFGYEVKEEIKEEVKEDNNAIEIIENEINELKKTYDYYKDQAVEVNRKISLLQDLLNKINK